ncbi:4-amino-4-deoxy-L-arabinose transferase-like glycosyltransferase [Desulfosalsimonas propionicica]|uniref:4-amino-4-deoxy-L-arabinose transferase-like glycosyltransferase n=1 Tax=Desulfosalsimonas propionicica TaxID=332175 RepID=A0A7W0C7W8_9BACT|nr:glycosyltransferase family 39 protein [Desulfosalsimonas propionicica]MBA2880800.1 4-amino-4-deoxy-L-arabinose transferase-like glycosyltransferase [Desulfosalsimonas propionicica]
MKKFENLFDAYEPKYGLLFCLALAAFIKILLLCLFQKPINADGTLYISIAKHFADGRFSDGMALYPMPFYPALIALVHFIIPNWDLAARLLSIFFMTFAIVPLYFLTRDLFNRHAAFWSAFAFAVSPVFNEWSVDVIRGTGFVFCVLWAVWLGQKALKLEKPAFFVWTGAISVISFLFRVEGIFLIVFFPLFCIVRMLQKPKTAVSMAKGLMLWLAFIAVLGGAGLTAAHLNQMPVNRLDSVTSKADAALQLEFMDKYMERYKALEKLEGTPPFYHGRQNLLETTRHFMYLVYLTGFGKIFIKVIFPCFFVALFFSSWRPMQVQHAFILGLIGFYLLLVYLNLINRDFMQHRFVFAPACLVYPWVGQGLNNLFNRVKNSFRPNFWLFCFLAVFLVVPASKAFHSVVKRDDSVIIEAGRFAKQNELLRDARVLTNDSQLPYYGGLTVDQFETIPNKYEDDYAGMGKIAIKKQIDIIYIKVSDEKDIMPQFSGYRLIKKFPSDDRIIYIFGSAQFCKDKGLLQ